MSAAMAAEQVCSAVVLLALALRLVLAAVVVAPCQDPLAHLLVVVVGEVCARDQSDTACQRLDHEGRQHLECQASVRASAAHPQAQP